MTNKETIIMNTFLTSLWLIATTGLGYFLGSLGNLSPLTLIFCAIGGFLVGLMVRFGVGGDGGFDGFDGFDSFDFGGGSDSCDSGSSCD